MKLNKLFWTNETNEAIKIYNTTTDKRTKDKVFESTILQALNITINSELFKVGEATNEDLKQDVLVHILLHIGKIDNYTTAQAYLTLLIRRFIRCYCMAKNPLKKYNNKANEDDAVLLRIVDNTPYDLVEAEEQKELCRNYITASIDEVIQEQQVLNSTKVAVLELLKQYLNDNNYDARGFADYACGKLGIKLSTFRTICSELGLSTKPLTERLIHKKFTI
jgi:hypothetical protein